MISISSAVKMALLASCLIATSVCADQAPDVVAGRAVCNKWSDAVVSVQLVIKMTMSYGGESNKREEKGDTVGTVVDPSGLTVVSLSSVSPDDVIDSLMGGGEDRPSISTQITDVKIRHSDGTETPAKIVLRDKDLDLAFVRPAVKPKEPWKYVDLKDSVRADVLDQVVAITRLGKVANRSIAVNMPRIQAVLEKPRRFYVVSLNGETGGPVGSLDGKIIGISLLRMSPASGRSSNLTDSIIPVVLPAEDIVEVAAQAPEEAIEQPAASAPPKSEPKPAPKPAKAPAKPKLAK